MQPSFIQKGTQCTAFWWGAAEGEGKRVEHKEMADLNESYHFSLSCERIAV